MAFTYTDLVVQIKATLNRTNDATFNSQLPNFIQQAQVAIARDSKFLGFQVSLTSNFVTANNGVLQKPDRWRQTISMNYGTGTNNATRNKLLLRTYEYVRNYWPDPTVLGLPKFYAEYGPSYWLLGPSPDQAYPFEVLIYMTPTELTSSNQENWLTQYCPDLLLYQCLLQAAPYLKNDSRIPTWKMYYEQARESQKAEFGKTIVDRQQMVQGA